MSKFYQAQLSAQLKDPAAAAMLSIIPGLGHIYEGQRRKGILFLAVSAINVLLFLVIACNQQLITSFMQIGAANHIQPNEQLITILKQIGFGSTVSIMFAGLVLSFLSYAIQDAYDQASLIKRRLIYPEHIMEMPEATSSSYIIHFAMMASCFVLAMFFLVPPKPKQQVTDIMFIQNIRMEKPVKPKTKIHATNPSNPSGKHNPNREIAKASSSSTMRTIPKALPIQRSIPAPPQPKMSASQSLAAAPMAPNAPVTTSTSIIVPLPAKPSAGQLKLTGLPALTPTQRVSSAQPIPLARTGTTPGTSIPQVSQINLSHGSNSPVFPFAKSSAGGYSHAPQSTMPVSSGNTFSARQDSQPMPKAASSSGSNGGQGQAVPTPIRSTANSGSGGMDFVPVSPSIPRPSIGVGNSHEGNSDANHLGDRSSPAAGHDADFGPYMDDLQRRIKRAWFPPKDLATKRVIVIFKIHSDGSLSHLRIERSSGQAIADQAALKAVESAQPFRQLPKYAPADVDIQFIFDYNIFGGQRR